MDMLQQVGRMRSELTIYLCKFSGNVIPMRFREDENKFFVTFIHCIADERNYAKKWEHYCTRCGQKPLDKNISYGFFYYFLRTNANLWRK